VSIFRPTFDHLTSPTCTELHRFAPTFSNNFQGVTPQTTKTGKPLPDFSTRPPSTVPLFHSFRGRCTETESCSHDRRQRRLKSFVPARIRTSMPLCSCDLRIGQQYAERSESCPTRNGKRAANSATEPASLAEASTYGSAYNSHVPRERISFLPSHQDVFRLIGSVYNYFRQDVL